MLTVRPSQMQNMAEASPGTKMVVPCAADATWIEVQLLDKQNNPMVGEKYQIRLPDSSLMEGTLDENGKVRFDRIVAGRATITFPNFDTGEWSAQAPDATRSSDSSANAGASDSSANGGSSDSSSAASA